MRAHFETDLTIDIDINQYNCISEERKETLPQCDQWQSLVVVCPYKVRKRRKEL